MKRIKSKSKDMKNLIDHGQEIMDENHGQEILDRKSAENPWVDRSDIEISTSQAKHPRIIC